MEIDQDPEALRLAMRTRMANIATSGTLAVIAAVFLYQSVTTLNYMGEYGPGPGFIPTWACTGALLACCWLLFQSFRGSYDHSGKADLSKAKPSGYYLAIMIASLLLVPFIGLLLAVFVFMLVSMLVVDRTELWRATMFSTITTLVLYLLLIKLLGTPMPGGMFTFLS